MAAPIIRITAWTVAVPLLESWISSPEFGRHASGKLRTLVEVCDGDGFTGWAESAGDQLSLIEKTCGRILGANGTDLRLNHLDLWAQEELYWSRPAAPSPYAPQTANLRHRLRHPLQALWECALTDLLARRAGVPVSHFFGGQWRKAVPTDYWAGRISPDQAAACARRARELGFKGMKLKTTLEDPNVERLEAIRDAAGVDFHVTVDPNGRFYRLDDAWKTIQRMDQVGNLDILEDPFPRFHLPEFVALRQKLHARLVVHLDPEESFWSVITSGAAGGLNIDSHRIGPFQWRVLAGAAEQANLLIWHGGSAELGIGTAWNLHLAACAPNCQLRGDQAGPWVREHTLVTQKFTVRDGAVVVPSGPGIGVEIDRAALDRYCQQQKSWETSQ